MSLHLTLDNGKKEHILREDREYMVPKRDTYNIKEAPYPHG